ncbi:alpha-amylase [Pseudomonas aeruginosa VRFPA09]|nr:alpha-amylase [Pseudomonas aeruginosa VRFPA09]
MARREKPVFLNDPQWYKDAVIYQVHVKSFYDANNDGIGDFAGLIEKLDYIADLGVNTLWLLPFYPSPRRDDGYDIAQYRGVHSDYGSLADARRFIAEAHRRGLRVITELVINHTSDQHPWFIRARHAKKGSRARDYYVWSDSDEKYQGTRIIFIDTEQSNWTWDPVAQQYYWHRFYSHQPDLNFDNPQVLREVLGVMRYWLDMGVDGLRLDAIPYLIERDGTSSENLPETHQVLKRIRAELDAHYPDRMLLAEANQWPEDTRPYFGGEDGGEGDECHMAFHFPLMPRMYMAIAQEDRYPITDILRQTPDIPANCQWAIFLRNHDELTLEMVTDDERDYLWNHYAADRRARLNLGIRRRLAPLVERDRRRIELLHSLLLSMPGTPTLYYGDEIGMGDNIYLGDRDGVRTPMQWSVDRNGGFSRADPAKLVLPPILDPLYGYQTINVEAQARDPHSLLNWMRRLLAVRSQQKAFGRGSLKMLAPSNRRILAYLREYAEGERQDSILCVANLSRAAQAVELDLASHAGKVPVEMIGGMSFPPIGELTYLLTLPPYGFYWFYLADATQMPSWHVAADERLPELPTLVVKQRLGELLQGASRNILEGETLPAYLPKRRWFAGEKGQPRLCYIVPLDEAEPRCALCEVEIDGLRYQLPLGFLDADQRGDSLPQLLALARLRRGRKVGLLSRAARRRRRDARRTGAERPRQRLVPAPPGAPAAALPPARALAGRRAGKRRPLCLRAVARRTRPLPVRRRQPPPTGLLPGRATDPSRRRGGRALRGLGAERRARLGGRRFQRLGRAPSPDATTLSIRRLGTVRPAPRRGRTVQVRVAGPRRPPAAEGRPPGAGLRDAARNRFEDLRGVAPRVARPGLAGPARGAPGLCGTAVDL